MGTSASSWFLSQAVFEAFNDAVGNQKSMLALGSLAPFIRRNSHGNGREWRDHEDYPLGEQNLFNGVGLRDLT